MGKTPLPHKLVMSCPIQCMMGKGRVAFIYIALSRVQNLFPRSTRIRGNLLSM
jgi:hypothetical protein